MGGGKKDATILHYGLQGLLDVEFDAVCQSGKASGIKQPPIRQPLPVVLPKAKASAKPKAEPLPEAKAEPKSEASTNA